MSIRVSVESRPTLTASTSTHSYPFVITRRRRPRGSSRSGYCGIRLRVVRPSVNEHIFECSSQRASLRSILNSSKFTFFFVRLATDTFQCAPRTEWVRKCYSTSLFSWNIDSLVLFITSRSSSSVYPQVTYALENP